ncbi:hypothetical protein C8F01DRAFT_1256655 [Mycena amicta]|nr:hypothetical protein C8F01DRAFT_1256655 [Mycena amicta]
MSDDVQPETLSWIAIEPVTRGSLSENGTHLGSLFPALFLTPMLVLFQAEAPPSFTESRFDIILRRQRQRPPDGGGIKQPLVPASRFLNLSASFEFAGWGSLTRLKLTTEEHSSGERRLQEIRRGRVLGQWLGAALPGNAVLGSVFYALPAVVAVSGVYSPISLFVATLTPFLWRPIMEELVHEFPISGAPYSYLLNVSRKSLALLAAALMLLDFSCTSVVSAATASSYITAELPSSPGIPAPALTLALLVLFAIISLSGLKESARIAAGVLVFHVLTMVVLALTVCVRLGLHGESSALLVANWRLGNLGVSASQAVKQLFEGFCLGMLGMTGIECLHTIIRAVPPRQHQFPLQHLRARSAKLAPSSDTL